MRTAFYLILLVAGLSARAEESCSADFSEQPRNESELKAMERRLFEPFRAQSETTDRALNQQSTFICEKGILNMSDVLVVEEVLSLIEGESFIRTESQHSSLEGTLKSASYQGDSVTLSLVDARGNSLPEFSVSANGPFQINLGNGIGFACGPKGSSAPKEKIFEKLLDHPLHDSVDLTAKDLEPKKSPKKSAARRPRSSQRSVAKESAKDLPAPLMNGEPFDPNFLRN